jgi:three-Cys-motif partner protein
MAQDRWPELCKLYTSDDGLQVREVGSWTEDKLFFWNRYIDITTRAMVGHPKWPAGLVYVDLFAGPGICKLRESGRRIPGSTLIAANTPKPFRAILAIELNADLANALAARLKNSPAAAVAKVFEGNCNTAINQLVPHIPERALTLGFIDPEALNVDFETVKKLSDCGQVDLLILFADRMDLVRNVDRYENENPSILDRMMGSHSRWRERWAQLANRSADNICRLFVDEYKTQLTNRLGYRAFGEKVMESQNGPIYRLIFASKNDKGLEFWDKVTQRDRDGQMGLPF